MTTIIDVPIIPQPHDRPHPTPGTDVVLETNQEFLAGVVGEHQRFHYASHDKTYRVNMPSEHGGYNQAAFGTSTVSLGFQAVHEAFAAHVPLNLRPDTLWYFIVHEVAEYVRQNPDECAHLFTDTPETRQTIEVRDDSLSYDQPSDWMRTINLFHDPLLETIGDKTVELFLPSFSTTTIVEQTALLVAFMDAASPFYEYLVTTRCGIPQIQLDGMPEDWLQLYARTETLASEFGGLSSYFSDLLPVLQVMAETAGGGVVDEHFWRSIYKYGGGSGGPYITGWMTAFFAFVQTEQGTKMKEGFDWQSLSNNAWGGYHSNDFPAHISQVPFTWDYYGTEYSMSFVAGVTSVGFDQTFLSPELGFAVVEV